MTLVDKINLAGIIFATCGSACGMFGILLQTNGYYAFKWFELFEHIFRVIRSSLTTGLESGRKQVQTAVDLADRKGENRSKSLIGLYLVLFGFLLQFLGSLMLVLAIFVGK